MIYRLINYFKSNIYTILFLLLFFYTGFNKYYDALDKIGFQWLYLCFFNILLLLYFYFNTDKSYFKSILTSKIIIAFSLFVLWSALSIFYSFNHVESLLILSRWLVVLITVINLTNLLFSVKNVIVLLSSIICFVLFFEVFYSLSTFFQIVSITDYEFSYSNLLKGVTGNKNITSSIIALKLPFVLFLFYKTKAKANKFFLFILYTLSILLLFALSSRAVLISLFFETLVLFFFFLFQSINHSPNKKSFKASFFFHIISLFVAFLSFQSLLPNNSDSSIYNRVLTINTEDTSASSRLRYYEHAVNHILDNPIIGTGLGNWKIKSIDYDSKNINGYTVPYHVHNDFLEIAAELGLIGVLLYASIFFIVLYYLFFIYKHGNFEMKFFCLSILLSGIVYVVDSSLNFPYARVVNILMFSTIISISLVQYLKFSNNE